MDSAFGADFGVVGLVVDFALAGFVRGALMDFGAVDFLAESTFGALAFSAVVLVVDFALFGATAFVVADLDSALVFLAGFIYILLFDLLANRDSSKNYKIFMFIFWILFCSKPKSQAKAGKITPESKN